MNIEQKVKEIEEKAFAYYSPKPVTGAYKDSLQFTKGESYGYMKALIVIKELQSELEHYKSLWETNAAESEEIIAELEGKDEWQPIETCPEDQYVFVWAKSKVNPEFGQRYEAYKKDNRFLGSDISASNIYEDMIYFTHWKNLPKPPKQNH